MKKIIAIVLSVMMVLGLFCACSDSEKAPTLRVAMSPDFAPMEFVDAAKTGQDQFIGFDVTLAKYLAKEMGMENCNLVTPDGYHEENHKLSLQAMTIIGTACLQDPTISHVVSSPTATISYRTANGETRSKDLKNTNHTIRPEGKYYHPKSVGLKTGFTDDAGYCLLTAYQIDGGYILIGIYGCEDANNRFLFANTLFEAFLPYIE